MNVSNSGFSAYQNISNFNNTQAASEVKLGAADNGKQITVTKGEKVVVELNANYTTPYRWQVTQTSRSLGYPEDQYNAPNTNLLGAGGTIRFTWDTDTLFSVGTHDVTLGNFRIGDTDSPVNTFSFRVVVKDS